MQSRVNRVYASPFLERVEETLADDASDSNSSIAAESDCYSDFGWDDHSDVHSSGSYTRRKKERTTLIIRQKMSTSSFELNRSRAQLLLTKKSLRRPCRCHPNSSLCTRSSGTILVISFIQDRYLPSLTVTTSGLK